MVALGLSACAHFPENRPLRANEAGGGYRFQNLNHSVANTNSLLVCLSFSGGGTRAAAFSLGVLRALRDTRIQDGSKRLLDEVDVISAVSGGAFTAAYLGLYGDERLFRDFESVLRRSFTAEIMRRGLLCPYNAIRLLSPWFERSDLAAELYGETIFGDKTYADLQSRGRPFVVLNATNLSLGERFEFTQDEFDRIGSALVDFPVGRAVAASSSFPFLLTPITLVNHPGPSTVLFASDAEATPPPTDRTLGGLARARRLLATDKERHPFVHLADGGVVDNLGLSFLIDSYRDGFIRELLSSHQVSTLVFIVVNAHNRVPEEMDLTARAPGVSSVVVSSMQSSIDRRAEALARTLEELRDAPDRRGLRGGASEIAPVRIHTIEVNLEDLPDEARRERLLAIGTNYALSPEEVVDVSNAGAELLLRSPGLAKLKAELR